MRIEELETFFNSIELVNGIRIDFGYIHNTKLFVETHISMLKGNKGNRRYLPYYDRLKSLHDFLNKKM